MHSFLIVLLSVLTSVSVSAQMQILDNISVYDKTTNKSVKLSKPSGISDVQEIVFPSAAGTVGQVLTITGKSGSTLTLGWSTESVSTVSMSDRIAGGDQDSATLQGLAVSLAANHTYHYSGVIRGNRKTVAPAGGATSDNFMIALTAPSNTNTMSLRAFCFDCPAGTVAADKNKYFHVDSDTYEATSVINPDGATVNYATVSYFVEGVVETGSSGGLLLLTIEKSGSDSNNMILKEHSYIQVTELD